MDIISVKGLKKDYYQYKVFEKGKILTTALDNISFAVKKGDFFGLLGKNGAGKSTLLKILTTNLEKSAGKVMVNGYDMDKDENNIKRDISWMFGVDYDGVGWSSVEKNLKLAAYFLGLKKGQAEKQVEELLKYFGLYKHRKLDVWRISTGMQGKYSLCVAMLKNPKILFLDEPLLGLDFEAKEQLRFLLQDLNKKGTTIVYTDQQLREVEKLCKNVVIIDEGKKMYDGPVERLKEKYRDTNILDMTCTSPSINAAMKKLEGKYQFITDYEIVNSTDGIHNVKIFTTVDSRKILPVVAQSLSQQEVLIEKLNAGALDLEDVFKKFLRKDKHLDQAKKLMNYEKTGERPEKKQEQYLRHKHPAVREAACKAFADHTDVEKTLQNMLALSKEMKIASLKVIGDKKILKLANHLKENSKDRDLQMHVALALGKIGNEHVADTLLKFLLEYPACNEVLLHVPQLDEIVLAHLVRKIGLLKKRELHFLLHQINKMEKKEEIKKMLQLRQPIHHNTYAVT